MSSTEVALVAASSFVLTAVTAPAWIALARRTDTVDRSGPLKPQRTAVPYLGGFAVFSGLIVGVICDRPVELVPLGMALAIGVADDRMDLDPRLRLIGHAAIGIVIVIAQPVHLAGWLGGPLIVFVTVLLINGFNLLDGLDMLAGGVGAAAAVGFALVTTPGPGRLTAVSLTSALAAFLWYNRPPARLYLGDGGSYLVGTCVALLLVHTWAPGSPTSTGVIALSLVALPVAEVACAVIRRRRAGISLTAGDRGHPYDLLVSRGWPPWMASVSYIGIEALVVVTVRLLFQRSVAVALSCDLVVGAVLIGCASLTGGLTVPAEVPS